MELRVEVGSPDGRFIHTTLSTMHEHVDAVRSLVYRKVIDTEDRMIREQLIKMGWTPPSEAKDGVQPDGTAIVR